MPVYHKNGQFPLLPLPSQPINLVYSNHALHRAFEYGIRSESLPKQINPLLARVIEIETRGNRVVKVLYRVSFDNREDILLPVLIGEGVVKTLWLNRKGDEHSTLQTGKYVNVG